MITAPLFVIILAVTIALLKVKKATVGSVVLGALLGLTMASTVLGAPVVNALTQSMTFIVDAIAGLVGGR